MGTPLAIKDGPLEKALVNRPHPIIPEAVGLNPLL